MNTKSSRFYTVKASIEYWAKDFEQGTQPEEDTVVSGEEEGKRLRDAPCDVTRPQDLPNRLWVGLLRPVMKIKQEQKLESRTIKEPVYRLIYDQLTEIQFLYDVKIICHALIQYPSSGVENGTC